MKTKNLVISGILVLMFASGTLFFISCKKESNEPVVKKDDNYALTNVGMLHNEALSYYYENRIKLKSTASINEILSESISLTAEYLINQGFARESVLDVKALVGNSLVETGLKSSPNTMFSIDTTSFIMQLDQQNLYSPEFIEDLNNLFILAHKDDNEEVVRDYVNNIFANVHYTNLNDVAAQKLYINIFNYSFDYWVNTFQNSSLKKSKLKLSSWVIINDGIGGILGSPLGPIGSIALGTAFSVGTNEGY